MRWLYLLLGLICASHAFGQSSTGVQRCYGPISSASAGCGAIYGPSAVGYNGPGDVVSGATQWYGLRAYTRALAATGTQKSINIRRTSDSATTDILILPSGYINVAASVSFCAATSCFVTREYDQTGGGNDLVQGTAANQPALIFNALGIWPTIQFSTSSMILASGSLTPPGTTVSLSAVAERLSGTGICRFIMQNGNNNRLVTGSGVANQWVLFGGTSGSFGPATTLDGAFHAGNAVINTISSVVNIDGVETTGTAVGNITAGAVTVSLPSASTTCQEQESGIWATTLLSAGQRAALNANQHAAWQF